MNCCEPTNIPYFEGYALGLLRHQDPYDRDFQKLKSCCTALNYHDLLKVSFFKQTVLALEAFSVGDVDQVGCLQSPPT